jgi:23S rRNA m2A2503 methyltransferase
MVTTDIKSMTMAELAKVISEMGEKPFKAKQVYEWLHVKGVVSIDEMTNLSKTLRERLKEQYPLNQMEIIECQESKLDGTRKYLLRLGDGNVVESVWMKYSHGNTVCISSQVGCRMGCTFCASTIGGLVRNLSTGEMLEQIYAIARDTKERVSNVVVMGMGEPLDNYQALVRFIHMISNEDGVNISQRNITISTCGLVPEIYELAKEKLQITLALSLHAPNDERRSELMPIAKKYQLAEVMAACQQYYQQTKRRLTFEYSLAAQINDSETEAKELAALLRGINCHVNLIPMNPVRERKYVQSQKGNVDKFKNRLEKCGINVTIRREMGRDIDGACGQLRNRDYLTKADVLCKN